ncbi:hypothetical protein [Cellulosilyticum sp. I15G10I2]|nr:hypothetical protein [Cellulosilyticum sp. I15G10I2]
MKSLQKVISQNQSREDHNKEAWNANNGFKTNGNSGVQEGIGQTKNKR